MKSWYNLTKSIWVWVREIFGWVWSQQQHLQVGRCHLRLSRCPDQDRGSRAMEDVNSPSYQWNFQVTSPEMFTGKMSNLHPPSLDDLDLDLDLDTNLTSDDILPLADVDAATILNPKSLGVSKQSQIDPNGFGQFGSQYTYKHDKYIQILLASPTLSPINKLSFNKRNPISISGYHLCL